MKLALADIDIDGLLEAADGLGVHVPVLDLPLDVTDRASSKSVREAVNAGLGSVHLLVNNAA